MHHLASLLLTCVIAVSLAGTVMTLVMHSQDGADRWSGLGWRQMVAARYRRHPLMVPATLACAVAGVLLLIAYNATV